MDPDYIIMIKIVDVWRGGNEPQIFSKQGDRRKQNKLMPD